MKVILIILLIIFLLIISLFSITIISRNKSTASEGADSLTTEESNKDSKTTVSDSRVTTIDDVQEIYGDDVDNISSGIKENEIEESSNTTGSTNDSEEETLQDNDEEASQTQLQDNEGNDSVETSAEKEEEIKNGTIKFFLDGDMENGIYLGETLCSMESAEASQLYGEDFKDTGLQIYLQKR
jgi:hypothetical protein